MAVDSPIGHSRICPAAEATVPLLPPILSVNSSLSTSEMAAGISDISPGSLDATIGATRETTGCAQESDLVTSMGSGSAPSQTPRPASVSVSGQPSQQAVSHTSETAGTNAPVRSRRSLLNSGLWIGVELVLTLSQVTAAIFVLLVSSNEKPKAPLGLWVSGYAVGCTATLPLLYWRYLQRCARSRDVSGAPAGRSVWTARRRRGDAGSEPHNPLAVPPTLQQPVRAQPSDSGGTPNRSRLLDLVDENRIVVMMDRFKCMRDIYFAVWFVLGNVWVFGGQVAPSDAPNLYSLCLVFLTLSCVGYAVPFLLCATICLCLPCIIALMGFVEEPMAGKGAAPAVISALPTYKYKLRDRESASASEAGEAGILWAGTEKERAVAGEDALCCICLGRYREGEMLKELPCHHHFHVSCVDTWLKINANCPLCKSEIEGEAASGVGRRDNAVAVVEPV